MTERCITNRHRRTQISVKETRTNSQQPSYLLIQPASKQKCCKTQITQSVSTDFSTDSSHIKIHQTYQSCLSFEDKVIILSFFIKRLITRLYSSSVHFSSKM
ncbi:hypothetical protein LDENG_00142730 [Lucifuga dentata]|nr:hypothetical protein LDENG_00142730 [Lucifuga dentata]